MKKLVIGIGVIIFAVIITEVILQISSFVYRTNTSRTHKAITEGNITILCAGDSYTWSLGSRQSESYPVRLELLLNENPKLSKKTQVINGGIPGMNSALIAEHIKKQFQLYKPDIVIVNGGVNNIWNRKYVDRYYYDRESLSFIQKLKWNVFNTLASSKLYKLIKISQYTVNNAPLSGKPALEPRELYGRDADSGIELVRIFYWKDGDVDENIEFEGHPKQPINWGSGLAFEENFKYFLMKSLEDIYGFLSSKNVPVVIQTYMENDLWSYQLANQVLVEFAQLHNLPVVRNDIFLEKNKLRQEDYILKDKHPNQKGYHIMAKNTADVVASILTK